MPKFPCACGKPAEMEKGGRTVCRECARHIKGREFPLRSGRVSAGCSTFRELVSMEMLEPQERNRLRSYAGKLVPN